MDGPRACHESEFDEVISLINSVFREGTDQDISTDYPTIFNKSKECLDLMRIVKLDGKVVSQVPVKPRQAIVRDDEFTFGIISPTVTHPDHQGNGYATLCLRDCVRIMEENDWPLSAVWTETHNFHFYRKSDFEIVSSQGWIYFLKPEQYHLFENNGFDIVAYDPANPAHLDAIMSIHEAEPYRIGRSRKEYELFFTLPKLATFLAAKDSRIATYLMFGEGLNKPGIVEAGGATDAVEALLRHQFLQRKADSQIQAITPATPTALAAVLDAKAPQARHPVEEDPEVAWPVMRINNLDTMLRGIKNFLTRKSVGLHGELCLVCKETDQAVTLKFADGSVDITNENLPLKLVLTRRQLAQLIFGPHADSESIVCEGKTAEIVAKVFPFYFPIWELDHS